MGWSTLFKYFGMAMEAAELAASAYMEVVKAKDPNSPGGSVITSDEKKQIIENLDDEMSTVITRICEEVGLPVESVNIEVVLK